MRELLIWIGPVHAGKSTRALIRAERYRRLGETVKLVRPIASIRTEQAECRGLLVTKTGHEFPSIDLGNASEIPDAAVDASVLWVDEPFMFAGQARLFSVLQAERRDKTILVSTLGATNELECIAEPIARLLAVADEIVHCMSHCDWCHSLGTATRSVYVGDEPKTGRVKVGGAGVYRAACPRCWNKL